MNLFVDEKKDKTKNWIYRPKKHDVMNFVYYFHNCVTFMGTKRSLQLLGLSMYHIGSAKEPLAFRNLSVDEGRRNAKTKKGRYQMAENNLKQFLPKFH